MTIDERIKLEEKAIKDMQFKEEALDGLPGYMVTKEDYEECRKSANEHQELINWLKELKAHREAWKGLQHDVYELHKILFNMKPQHRSTTVAGDILGLIEAYRPKEGDVE
ncbi:MAG: hypothetical protein IJ880_16395 [Bacilli bacterium]|nr:hypothetical protein [Bacilli bacterium]